MIRFIPLGIAITVLFINIASNSYITTKSTFDTFYEARTAVLTSEKLLSSLKDAETGQRGYILTENEDFLEPYNRALQEIEIYKNRLENSQFSQTEKMVKINDQCQKMVDYLARTIKLVAEGKKQEAASKNNILEGKKLMDGLRVIITDLERTVSDIHIKERDKIIQGFSFSNYLLYINGITAFLLIFLLLARIVEERYKVT